LEYIEFYVLLDVHKVVRLFMLEFLKLSCEYDLNE